VSGQAHTRHHRSPEGLNHSPVRRGVSKASISSSTVESMDPLAGLAEIVEMLGVSTQRVHQLAAKVSFPAPVVEHSYGRAWKTEEIKKWANAGREIHRY
jgi:hypothetical protein